MTEFTVYSADNAPEAAKPRLKAAKASFAFMRGKEWPSPP